MSKKWIRDLESSLYNRCSHYIDWLAEISPISISTLGRFSFDHQYPDVVRGFVLNISIPFIWLQLQIFIPNFIIDWMTEVVRRIAVDKVPYCRNRSIITGQCISKRYTDRYFDEIDSKYKKAWWFTKLRLYLLMGTQYKYKFKSCDDCRNYTMIQVVDHFSDVLQWLQMNDGHEDDIMTVFKKATEAMHPSIDWD